MFLDPIIVQLLASIGFFAFVFDFFYVLCVKHLSKRNGNNNSAPLVVKHSVPAKFGIIALDIMIFACCVMIFAYRTISAPLLPRVWAGEGAAVMQVVGFTLVIGGDVVLFLAYKALGIYWAYPLDGKTGKHKLVKDGPYKHVRHPVYDSFGIIAIGFVLLFLDWILLVLCIVSCIGLYAQAFDEEKALMAYFGPEYEAYMQGTGRFFSMHRG